MQKLDEILKALNVCWKVADSDFQNISEVVAMSKPLQNVWSISEELAHMILSAAPIAKVLNLGATDFLEHAFPERKSLNYDELEALYWKALGSNTITAPARYVQAAHEEVTFASQRQKWLSVGVGITDGLSNWTEVELDSVQLKHPLLGPLTMREMLFFTHIHSKHHFSSIQKKAAALSNLN